MPTKDAPPTVEVFCFFSIKKAIILAAGMHIKRSVINIIKIARIGVDAAPSNIIITETAKRIANELKKPYHVRFQPCQLPLDNFL